MANREANAFAEQAMVGHPDRRINDTEASNTALIQSHPIQTLTSGGSAEAAADFSQNSHHDFSFFNASSAPQGQGQVESPIPESPWCHVAHLPFDASLLLPDLYNEENIMNNWFPDEFYIAMQETGNDWMSLDDIQSSNQFSFPPDFNNHDVIYTHGKKDVHREPTEDVQIGRASQMSSPPNEASEEDKWPFAWNPRSRRVLDAKPISIPNDHILYHFHDFRYSISEATYQKVAECINFANDHALFGNQRSSLRLPALPITNLFIGLFFRHFYPQMPVIHLATLRIDEDLPPPLLAAMVVIGAIYSYQKHTRRFAIVLLDLVRRSLIMGIEYDNSLIREPMIIYALLLVCHAGLWCGNKRAFELAEVIRGSVVSYCRRTGFGVDKAIFDQETRSANNETESQWKRWISEETQKRLYWAVYILDCQFPSLLNLPSTISRGEVSGFGCPCDESFWHAPSAWHWKRLLGPAIVPPSISFATAIGPFVVPPLVAHRRSNNSGQNQYDGKYELHTVQLNDWSKFLVLLVIQIQIFEYSQEMMVAGKICGDESHTDSRGVETRFAGFDESTRANSFANLEHAVGVNAVENMTNNYELVADQIRAVLRGSRHTSNWAIWKRLATAKTQLADSLMLWSKAYIGAQSILSPNASDTSTYFSHSSKELYKLSCILLEVSLTDLQDALGKSGPSKISFAMSSLSLWANISSQSLEVALESVKTIDSLTPAKSNSRMQAPPFGHSPYSIISFFLCHITLWAFISTANHFRARELLHLIESHELLNNGPFIAVVKMILTQQAHSPGDNANHTATTQKLLFRSAAEVLTRMGTWGCSLNLAMMLYKRAEM